jgi:hypothetical protein
MLPVKMPKVPASALKEKKQAAANNESGDLKLSSNSGDQPANKSTHPPKPPTTLVTSSAVNSNKLFPKMKR